MTLTYYGEMETGMRLTLTGIQRSSFRGYSTNLPSKTPWSSTTVGEMGICANTVHFTHAKTDTTPVDMKIQFTVVDFFKFYEVTMNVLFASRPFHTFDKKIWNTIFLTD